MVKAVDGFDFGVFIFRPDDVVTMRKKEYSAVRDNVVFELGVFVGKLGPHRSLRVDYDFAIGPVQHHNVSSPVTRFPQTPAEFRNISRRVLCFSKNFGLIFVRLSNVDFVRLISYEGIDVPNKITLTNAKNNRICNAN
jgi:CAP12/Pycsar effector protein, TIR domain